MNKQNIEAEGGELVLQSREGHYAIIPSKHRQKVTDMLKEGCDDCINSYIQTLPRHSDYAEDGGLYSDVMPSSKDGKDSTPDRPYYGKMLPEVTVVGEAPLWVKYKREYIKNNPFDIDKYVEDRFNNPVGRENIEKIDEKGWRRDLVQEGWKNRYNTVMDYVGEELVKNKPQGELSRAEWLNQMTAREEAIIKRNPKYQSSLWTDTMRGFISIGEPSAKISIEDIKNNPDYSDREKDEMISSYQNHPLLAKFTDATKVLDPLTIPSKMVQSAYKDNYSFTDALGGKKNDAGVVEDFVTDPLNLLMGAGMLSKASKASKVLDVTKTEELVLPKLKQVPLDFKIEDLFTLSSFERKNMEIVRKGNQYFKNLNNPESLKRLKEFESEYGIDLLDAYKRAKKRWDRGAVIGGNKRFQVAGEEIFKGGIEDAMGVSTVNYKDLVENLFLKRDLSEGSINYINKRSAVEDYDMIVWHELSHDINKNMMRSSKKLKDDISNIFVKNAEEVDKTDALKAGKISRSLYKSDLKRSNKGVSRTKKTLEEGIEDELDYISEPTETWAFLSTNLRQDLKNTGVIENYNELLTSEKLEQAIKNGNTVFSRFEPYIKDKDAFIRLFNKMTLSIAPAVLYFQSQQNKDKNELK